MNGIAFNTLQSANKNEPKVDVKDEKTTKNNETTSTAFSSVLNTEESGRTNTTNSTGTNFFGNNESFKNTSNVSATTEVFVQ